MPRSTRSHACSATSARCAGSCSAISAAATGKNPRGMSLLVVFFLIFVVMAAMSSSAARRRRRREEERRLREEELMRQGGGAPQSPFGGSPLGMLFDSLFTGAGGWSRGYTLDPETGRWVEVTPQTIEQPEAAAAEPEPEPADDASREER